MSLDIRPDPSASRISGGLVYKGTYNATTNTPDLTSSLKGDFYIVDVAGTLAGITLNVGDHIVFNQDASSPITSAMFDVIDNTDQITSVNGQTGPTVTLTASDVNALATANDLSDLNDAATARTNLGLGTAATQDVGTSASNVVQLDGSARLPAVDGSQLTNISPTGALLIANNLSDLNNTTTARTNLGLGTAATQDVGTSASNVVQLDGSARLPAVDGSQLTNVSGTDSTKLAIANNLSDLNNAATARTNLGLGTAATQDVGTANGNIVQLDATGLPAVDGSQLTNVTGTDSTKLAIANNLSDLNNVATARTNLGLGTAATQDVGTSASNVVQLDGSARLPAVDGSQLTNISPTGALLIANNLSDLNNTTTARTNLGLGTAATQDVGTANGNVVQLDATGLPAVDGSQLTNVSGTDSTKLAIANNLSDLNNVATARTNLGLGTAATQDVGTSASNVVQLDGSARLPAVDGSQLTNISPTGALLVANNLSDLNNAATARTNLGLGTSATLDVGTSANNVVQLNVSAQLPAVDGSLLTGITTSDTLDDIVSNGAITATAIQTGGLTVTGDIDPNADATYYLGDETTRFISYYGDMNGAIRFKAKVDQTGGLSKGEVVYIKGVSGSVPTVGKAQANSASTMPAFGLVFANANDTADVEIITFGNLEDMATNTFGAGDTLYVSSSTAGGLVNSAPTGESNLIQNIGFVVRSDASAGIVKVGGAGRTNATPNLDQDKIFLGNGSNQAVSTALSSIGLSGFNNDAFLEIANNLSDLNNVATARTNLGLGTAATQDVGTANGNVVQLDATGLPAVDGSQLTNVSATDSTKLAIANNLSDLNNVATARTNLGLGTAATQDVGTANGNVVQLDATGLPAVDGSQLTNVTATPTPPNVTTDSSGTNTTISTTTGAEEIHLISNGSSAVTITIPTAATSGSGYRYHIKRLGTADVTVQTSSGTIDAQSTYILSNTYESVSVISDGSNYFVI